MSSFRDIREPSSNKFSESRNELDTSHVKGLWDFVENRGELRHYDAKGTSGAHWKLVLARVATYEDL